MLDPIKVLHDSARRYCMEQAAQWRKRYADLSAANRDRIETASGEWDYADEAWAIFPRYQVFAAIQRDVERFVPTDFRSADELRSLLVVAAETAHDASTKFDHPIAKRAAEEERQRFAMFIQSASESDAGELPPLPFRRILSEVEHRDLYAAFERRWGRWYGGAVDRPNDEAAAITLHIASMSDPSAYESLRRLLEDHGIGRVVELREWGDGFEVDIADSTFTYTGAEGFWTSTADMEWMVYASHESSITFGGRWLIEGMRRFLPMFDRYLYRGWDLKAYDFSDLGPEMTRG